MGKAARRHDERKRGKKPVSAHRMYVRCLICGKRLRTVNAFHLRTHETTVAEYKENFGLTFVACDETR
jgi:predicted transcriptional regulator